MNVLELDFERAKARHLLFKTRLRSILYGADIDETTVISHRECALGQWIYDHAIHDYGHIKEMHDLEKVHLQIHKSAGELIKLYKEGKITQAQEGLLEIEIIATQLVNLLSVVELKIKAEDKQQSESNFSDELRVNYNELLQLNNILQDLDQRIKDQTEKSVLARKQADSYESKFRNTMMQAPVGITILRGGELLVEMANDSYLEIVDKREDEFVGRPLFDSMPEVKGSIESILHKVLETGIPYYGNEFEIIIKRSGQNERCYFNFVYQPLIEDNFITGIIVIATEVTKQVETNRALQNSENHFRNLVTQSQFAKAIFSGEDFVISIANESLLKTLWRRELHEVQGRKLLDVFPELADQKFPAVLKEVYTTGKTYRENEAVAYIDGFDGIKKYYLDYQYAPMFATDGSVSGIMVSVNDVTEKVESRQKIADAADRLSLATEGTQLATWDLNIQTREIIYSSRLAEIFGFDSSVKLSHQDLRDHIHPEDIHRIVEPAFASALETGMYYYEARIVHPDNSIHWIRTQGKVLFDASHLPLRMLGTMMDITEKKQTEQIIQESENRYRDLIETLPVAVYTIDHNGYVDLYNKAAVKLWGREPMIGVDTWCGSHELYNVNGTFTPHDECPMAVAFKEKKSNNTEAFIKRPDGTIRHIIAHPQPIIDSNGGLKGALNVLIDITDRKEAEFALRTSEGKFRTLADSMPQFIWTGDTKGYLNYFNKSVYDYSGLSPEEIEKNGWIEMVHPADRSENLRLWTESIKNGTNFLFEHRFRKHDGEYRWQLSRAIPQKDVNGIIQMWVGTSTDIHDSKLFIDELESKVQLRTKELTAANDELVKTNMELAQFAYVASHDLQEPLRKIQTFATRILETEIDNLSPKGKDYFDRMRASSTRMQQLIVDLLAFSRANAVEKHFERTNLNGILVSVKEQLNELIQQKNATIISGELPVLSVITYQFEQLFTNLIANSLKFIDPETDPVIEISAGIISGEDINLHEAQKQTTYHFISFKDNGIGFEQQFKDRIFQVFQRLHSKNAYDGTGIGLAICKKIIENHHGLIDAKGEPGVGSTFTIYLPSS